MKGLVIFVLLAIACAVVGNWGWPSGGALELSAFVFMLSMVYILGSCFRNY
jgi:hypothetical protein